MCHPWLMSIIKLFSFSIFFNTLNRWNLYFAIVHYNQKFFFIQNQYCIVVLKAYLISVFKLATFV